MRLPPTRVVFAPLVAQQQRVCATSSLEVRDAQVLSLYAWGSNSSGQLGGTGANSYTPTKAQAESNVIAIGAGYYRSLLKRWSDTKPEFFRSL